VELSTDRRKPATELSSGTRDPSAFEASSENQWVESVPAHGRAVGAAPDVGDLTGSAVHVGDAPVPELDQVLDQIGDPLLVLGAVHAGACVPCTPT